MTDTTDVLNAIAKIVEEVTGIPAAEVTGEKAFTDDLDIDSLSMVEITVVIEDRFDVKIPDGHLSELRTVDAVVRHIADHRS
ncbi:acyl carrier protein [Streptomyces sp. NPDC087440]|uniref:acyl carrier protein n=1 Tax=Streptomyces sp. NPDC087440 TaxID=3365790 RepID=UPI0037FF4FA1